VSDVFECGIEIFGFSSQAPPFRITGPNGGEAYDVGQTMTITWEANREMVSDANIELSLDGGLSWYGITGESSIVPEDSAWGSFEWVIPSEISDAEGNTRSIESSECLLKIWDYGNTNYNDRSDAMFTIGDADVIGKRGLAGPAQWLVKTSKGMLLRAQRRQEYEFKLISANGRTVWSRSGHGPARHVLSNSTMQSGVFILSARVGSHTRRVMMTIVK
jgi:hypothetical protein